MCLWRAPAEFPAKRSHDRTDVCVPGSAWQQMIGAGMMEQLQQVATDPLQAAT